MSYSSGKGSSRSRNRPPLLAQNVAGSCKVDLALLTNIHCCSQYHKGLHAICIDCLQAASAIAKEVLDQDYSREQSAPVDADAASHEGDERASDEGGAHKDGRAVLRHAEAARLAADADGPAATLRGPAHLVVLTATACYAGTWPLAVAAARANWDCLQ